MLVLDSFPVFKILSAIKPEKIINSQNKKYGIEDISPFYIKKINNYSIDKDFKG
jgi:hypothetical protein